MLECTEIVYTLTDVDYQKISDSEGLVPLEHLNSNGVDATDLYIMGKQIISEVGGFSSILNFNIFGFNIWSLMLPSGFLLYMGWCLVKWVIPT